MNPFYITTNLDYYRWPPKGYPRKRSYIRHTADAYAADMVDKDQFLSPPPLKKVWSSEEESLLAEMYKERMKTTYQRSYCKEELEEEEDEKEKEIKDVFLQQNDRIFHPQRKKIRPPGAATYRMFGFHTPESYYTGITEYQDVLSRVGFIPFEKEREAGIERLNRPLSTKCIYMFEKKATKATSADDQKNSTK